MKSDYLQMRIDPELKARVKARAREATESGEIASYILGLVRRDLGEEVLVHEDLPIDASVEIDSEVQKGLERLTRQLQAQGRPDPEGEARRRLGL